MTDTDRPNPAQADDGTTGGPDSGPAGREPAAPRDPIAERDAAGSSEGARDPEGLDQSVGRDDAGQAEARTRDGAI